MAGWSIKLAESNNGGVREKWLEPSIKSYKWNEIIIRTIQILSDWFIIFYRVIFGAVLLQVERRPEMKSRKVLDSRIE